MKAISIKQPLAYLIASGIKDVENRTWKCPEKYIGERVLIHASAKHANSDSRFNYAYALDPNQRYLSAFNTPNKRFIIQNGCSTTSAIIGSVEIVDCVINHPSIWAEKSIDCKDCCPDVENCPAGKCPNLIYNWILATPIIFDEPILNIKGKLGFWDYEFSEDDYECTNDNGYTIGSCGERAGCPQDCSICDYYKCRYDIE